MTLYAGIDLHSTNSVLAVTGEGDQIMRQGCFPNDLPAILKALEPFRGVLAGVAVESTYNWYWSVDGLADHGYRVHLVNTAAVPQYDDLKYGGDDMDARHLVHLLCAGILSEGYIYPTRAPSDLLRRRYSFVPQGVGVMQAVNRQLAHSGH